MKSRYRSLVVSLGLMLVIFGTIIRTLGQEKDWLGVVYGDWGVEIINWSPKRRLVATALIPKNTPIWVSGGWGWYEAGNLKKVEQLAEDKIIIDRVMFYNFGLIPDKYIKSDKKMTFEEVLGKWSVGRWWWWKWDGSSWIVKEDRLEGDWKDIYNLWDKLVITGYAPVDRIGAQWRVYNGSQEKGIGSFLAQRLVWGGMWVSNVANSVEPQGEKCLIRYRLGKGRREAIEQINKVNRLWGCKVSWGEQIKDGIEVVIGPGMANLLKYNSYVRAF